MAECVRWNLKDMGRSPIRPGRRGGRRFGIGRPDPPGEAIMTSLAEIVVTRQAAVAATGRAAVAATRRAEISVISWQELDVTD
jgi:hypothetical protein